MRALERASGKQINPDAAAFTNRYRRVVADGSGRRPARRGQIYMADRDMGKSGR